MYIQNYSFISDIKLLIVTFKIMFMKESTEGVEENQILAMPTQENTDKE